MFYELRIRGNLKTGVLNVKKYLVGNEFPEENKVAFATEVLKDKMMSFYNYNCGSFVGVKSVNVLNVYNDIQSYNSVNLEVDAIVYFYKVQLKQIIDFKISKITPTFVQGTLFNATVEIPKDQLSNLTPVYVAANNSFQVGDKQKIRESDYLRAKVTSVLTSSHRDYRNPHYKIKASCRNQGTGKVHLGIVNT